MNRYACWLNSIEGIGRKTIYTLLESRYVHSAQEIYELSEGNLSKLCGEIFRGTSGRTVAERITQAQGTSPHEAAERLAEQDIHFVSVEDPHFPARLREIPDKPYALYYKGRFPSDHIPSVAIVGTRDCSIYGQEEAAHFAKKLALRGINIVSGMARGIDGIAGMAAARASLDLGGSSGEANGDIRKKAVPSYAVLGCGVDICYPRQNRALYDLLCDRGGVLSESVPGTEPKAGLFPQRNRIISGLADYILVIEARERSGTLITVDQALEQGRVVYALPGRVSDPLSRGCNTLLRQGAVIATDPEDILEDIFGIEREPGIRISNNIEETVGAIEGTHSDHAENSRDSEERLFKKRLEELSGLERAVAGTLHRIDPITAEQIADRLGSGEAGAACKVNTSDVLIALVQLQVRGLAREIGGGYYVRG